MKLIDRWRREREFAQLLQKAPDRRFLHVQLDTTNVCNIQCVHCSVHLVRDVIHTEQMPLDLYQRIAREVFPHTRDLCLSALAEPLMSRIFPEMLAEAKAHGVPYFRFITNGLLLDEKKAGVIVDSGMHHISISIDAATQPTYGRVRGGELDRVWEGLRILQRMKRERGVQHPVVQFNYVMLRSNLEEMVPLVEKAHELGVQQIDFRLPFLFQMQNLDDELPSKDPSLANRCMDAARRRCEELGIALTQMPPRIPDDPELAPTPAATDPPASEAHPACPVPWFFLVISSKGTVHPCCSPFMLSEPGLGSFRDETFAEIWTNEDFRQLRKELETGRLNRACAACKQVNFLASYDLPAENFFTQENPRFVHRLPRETLARIRS
jgi:radical SAM protein with 4Fe4S-binding SPASM domain